MTTNSESLKDEEPSKPQNDLFSSIGWLLEQPISEATLATAVEQRGIYAWDRFGRFGKADEVSTAKALDLLEAQYVWSSDPTPDKDDPRSPLDRSDGWDNPYHRYGWFEKDLPDFQAIEEGLVTKEPTQTQSGRTKRIETLQIIIAALAKKARMDLTARGIATEIKGAIELIGLTMSQDTIRGVLKDVEETLKSRG